MHISFPRPLTKKRQVSSGQVHPPCWAASSILNLITWPESVAAHCNRSNVSHRVASGHCFNNVFMSWTWLFPHSTKVIIIWWLGLRNGTLMPKSESDLGLYISSTLTVFFLSQLRGHWIDQYRSPLAQKAWPELLLRIAFVLLPNFGHKWRAGAIRQ